MVSKEQSHPFYKPLWRRILIIAAVALWAAYEVTVTQSGLWMVVALGVLGYAVWTFLITFPKDGADPKP
jgi:TctA family transporter